MTDVLTILGFAGSILLAGVAGILLYLGSRPSDDWRPPWWEVYDFGDDPGPIFGSSRDLPAREIEEAEVGNVRIRV